MISKEFFCKALKQLQASWELEDKLWDAMEEYNKVVESGFDMIGFGCINMDLCVDLLKELMHDTFDDISYFVYELEFGKKYEPGMVTVDDVDIDFSTAEKLYDYLIDNYQEDWDNE